MSTPLRDPLADRNDIQGQAAPSGQQGSGLRFPSLLLTSIGVVGVAAWIHAFDFRPETVIGAVTKPGWIVAGCFSFLLPLLFHTIRYASLLRFFTSVPGRLVLRLVLACTFLNHFVVASAGDFAEPLWLKRSLGVSYWLGLRVGLLRFAHSAAALLLLATLAWAAWWPLLVIDSHPSLAWLPLAVAIAGIGIAVASSQTIAGRLELSGTGAAAPDTQVRPRPGAPGERQSAPLPLPSPSHRRIERVARIRQATLDLAQAAARVPVRWHVAFIAFATLELALDGLPYLLFAWGVGLHLPLWSLLTGAVSLNVLEYLPTPPAMLGVQSWVAMLSLHSDAVPTAALAVAVALHRALRTLVITVVGLVPLLALSRRPRPADARFPAAEEDP